MSQSNIVQVTIHNFEQEVLLRSRELPVLVEFWANWGPDCRELGSVLDQLARNSGGLFLLAKVDIEAVPEVAQAFRIQDVPTVVLLVEGRPVDAFAGPRDEAGIRTFLEKHLGALGSSAGPLEDAKELEAAGRFDEAIEALTPWLEAHADDVAARIALASVLVGAGRLEDADAALALLSDEARESADAKSVVARLELLRGAGDVEALRVAVGAAPLDIAKRIEFGQALVAGGEQEEGLEELFEAAMRDIHFEDDAPRKALIDVFQALGPMDPLTLEFQQRLSVLLCS